MTQVYQLDLFNTSFPPNMACSNDLNNVVRLPRTKALEMAYIAPNNSSFINCMLLDLDYEYSGSAWVDEGVSPPNWICINPKNGHSHYGYILNGAVCRTVKAGDKPQRYFARIEQALTTVLKADQAYAHFLTKTPMHPKWDTKIIRQQPYSLDELTKGIDGDMPLKIKRETATGYGRNMNLFDSLRAWAYKRVLKFDDFEPWFLACLQTAISINTYQCPLPYNEVKSTAKSVAKWTYKNFKNSIFSEIQRTRGLKGLNKRWSNIDKNEIFDFMKL